MKKVYTVIQKVMNGTVTMGTDISSYETKELADKVVEALKDVNKDKQNMFGILYEVKETTIFENESEIWLFNKEK